MAATLLPELLRMTPRCSAEGAMGIKSPDILSSNFGTPKAGFAPRGNDNVKRT